MNKSTDAAEAAAHAEKGAAESTAAGIQAVAEGNLKAAAGDPSGIAPSVLSMAQTALAIVEQGKAVSELADAKTKAAETKEEVKKTTEDSEKAARELNKARENKVDMKTQEGQRACERSRAEADLKELVVVFAAAKTQEKRAEEKRLRADNRFTKMQGILQTSEEANDSACKTCKSARGALDTAEANRMAAQSKHETSRTAAGLARQRLSKAQQAQEGWRTRLQDDVRNEADKWRMHLSVVASRNQAEDSLASSASRCQAAEKDVKEKDDAAAHYLAWEVADTRLQSTQSLTLQYLLSPVSHLGTRSASSSIRSSGVSMTGLISSQWMLRS